MIFILLLNLQIQVHQESEVHSVNDSQLAVQLSIDRSLATVLIFSLYPMLPSNPSVRDRSSNEISRIINKKKLILKPGQHRYTALLWNDWNVSKVWSPKEVQWRLFIEESPFRLVPFHKSEQ